MHRDQICPRVMLFSLGATALTGVAAIFTQGHEIIWRSVATGATTTTAAGLMWPLTRTPRNRRRASPAWWA